MSGGDQRRSDGRRRVLTIHPGIRADVAARVLDTLTEHARQQLEAPYRHAEPVTPVGQVRQFARERRAAVPIVEPRSDGLAVYARPEEV